MALSIIRWIKDYQIDITQSTLTTADNTAIAYRICQDLELKSADLLDLSLVLEMFKVGDIRHFLKIVPPYLELINSLIPAISQNRSFTRMESAWLAWQVAYLKGFRDVLGQEQWLNRLWIKRGSIRYKTSEAYEPLHEALLKLKQYDLNEEEAEDSLSLVERSGLIKHFDDIAIAWLMAYGAELKQAQLIVRRLNHSLWGYLLEVVIQNPLSFVQLQSFVSLNQSLTQQQSDGIIDRDQEQYRANLVKSLNEPFRGEYFALKDLYVKPSGMPIVEETENPYDLHDWARAQLELSHSISFIEGPSGSGKSAFCKIFATYVSRFLYPEWMPVVVNLQRLTLGKNLIHSLESLTEDFPPFQEWLTKGKMRCVLLLDGLDNLRPLPNNHQHPALILLRQITQFLEDSYLEHKVQKYKIILTGNSFESLFRPNERQNLNRQPSRHSSLPMLMETHGIRLLAFEKAQIRKWFQKWLLIQSKPISQAYFQFLKSQRLFDWDGEPEPIREFVNRPGVLFLLAILYRDGLIKPQLFKCSLVEMQFQFHELLWQWLLGKPLCHQLPEIVKDGMAHSYRTNAIASTLVGDRQPDELLASWGQCSLDIQQGKSIPQSQYALFPPLLFQEANTHLQFSYGYGYFSFQNKHLLHPFIAQHIANHLQTLDSLDTQAQGELIYGIFADGLDHGVLALLVEYLQHWAKSHRHQSFFKDLYVHLKSFYRSYCHNYWLFNAPTTAPPATRLRQERAVGVNVFILITLISKLLSAPFHPCGLLGEDYDRDRFKNFLNKINFSDPGYSPNPIGQYFAQLNLMGVSLDGLNLTSVDLTRSNLAFASFTQANLEGTNVAKANVPWSNFSYANCKGANLSEINAEGADFSYADLTDADLSNAYLKNCCFYRANLNEEQRKILTGKPVFFDREGFDLYNQDLLRQNHKTYALNVTLTEHGDAIDIDIESAEGDLLENWANPDDAPVLRDYSETLITNTGHESQEEPSPFFVLDNLKHLQTQVNEENIETMIIDS